MRKFVALFVCSALVLWVVCAMAKVTGPCADCHTMHYSQGGNANNYPSGGPFPSLTIGDCIGCHAGNTPIKGTNDEIPVVLRNTEPTGTGPNKSLAGGDFYWVGQGDDAKGHNVVGISGEDQMGRTPPGWDPTDNAAKAYGVVANGEAVWSKQLTCAGTYGCHGYHDEENDYRAIKGAHHGNDDCLKADTLDVSEQGTSTATSYRFLYGIKGIEDKDWEYTAQDGSTDHNQYYGVNGNTNQTAPTVSFLCAECHGDFHADIQDGNVWIRHPTDIVLPAKGEYEKYNGGTGSANPYSVLAPVGSDLSTGVRDTINPGSADAIVLCVSCHRAHGSEYDDILRWNYTGECEAGQGDMTKCGCKVCHTEK